jgi:hypothetical protein
MSPSLPRVVAVAALLAAAAAADAEDRKSARETGPEQKEAALAASVLAAENGQLRDEVEALRADLEEARRALARTVAELDVERSRAAGRAAGTAGGAVTAAEAAVVDASRDLGMVVLGIGAGAGVKPGMSFAVLRGDRVVARVRAMDVRAGVTGARVEELVKEENFPKQGDRAVIWREGQQESGSWKSQR